MIQNKNNTPPKKKHHPNNQILKSLKSLTTIDLAHTPAKKNHFYALYMYCLIEIQN